MGQALYRKYRSKSFDEVIGQAPITATLQEALKSGRISHAYLFSGPRGVGKTSVARILAHQVNQLTYDESTPHLDIIEIDAASNRRIDEIRDLREKVHIAPTSAKYKVYIIDEAHMLTREAFNALLKTLEEPPAHCIFILATTEAHKLPATIISRTQRFNFQPIATSLLAAQLAIIAKKEKIDITPAALDLIAEYGEGSFRDGLSLLDQLSTYGQIIDEAVVLKMLGQPPQKALEQLLAVLSLGDHSRLLAILESFAQQGVNPTAVAKRLAKSLRHQLIKSPAVDQSLVELLKDLVEVPASFEPAEALELALLKAISQPTKQTLGKPRLPPSESAQLNAPKIRPSVKKPASRPRSPGASSFDLSHWPQVLSEVKAKAASLYTALRLATPGLEGETLTLAFEFRLHQKKLEAASAKQLIESIIAQKWSVKLKVRSLVDKHQAKAKATASTTSPQKPPQADTLGAINSIFGGAEVLESQEQS